MNIKSNNTQAILWVLLSTALFTIIFAAAKFADGAIGTFQILLLRYVGSFVTVLILASRSGRMAQHWSKKPQLHFIRALFGSFAAAAITWASANMPIADATAIGMLNGILTVILGILFLKEYVGLQQWIAVSITFAGAMMVMIAQGAFQNNFVAIPATIALISAVLLAAEGLLIRILSQTETAITMMLHVSFFGICLMSIPATLEWQSVSPEIYLSCIALGPLSVLGQYCTIRGYRIAPLSVVGPIDYSWLIFATLLGVVVFTELPGLETLVGGGLIILGGILLSKVQRLVQKQ